MMRASVIFIVAMFPTSTVTADDKQTIIPFINGMTIMTSDVVANVEVRAQSFGPGFCGVDFIVNGKTTPIIAPPFKYSDWKVLLFHLGKASITIDDDVKCDTGIMAQVRYFKG